MQPLRLAGFIFVSFLAGALPSCSRPREVEPAVILTPLTPPTPRINCAKIFSVRPGSPFLFQIAASGARPMEFEAENLPEGLSLDRNTGSITGTIASPGQRLVRLRATNRLGVVEEDLTVIAGDEVSLTPPMGWNSWNIWGGSVSQERVAAAARALVTSGLRDHGWTYVNVDDGWQGKRGGDFNAIHPNGKFPDMAALANEVHALGLKFGIYSTPWRTSFNGHIGSSADFEDGSNEWLKSGKHNQFFKYRFASEKAWWEKYSWLKPLGKYWREKEEERTAKELRKFGKFSFVRQDVAQWRAWGVDYLKYDWIPIDTSHVQEMRQALRALPRDVVYSVANNAPFQNALELSRVANSWRTSGDVKDDWGSVSQTGFSRDRWAPFNIPGHYNDADMLVLGQVGWGKPRPTRLTPNEQYSHMSLWCLLSGPLLLGCDLEKLDPFTFGLLTNDEVIEVNQDSLCQQARRVATRGSTEIYAKKLTDGSWAVGMFNRGESEAKAVLQWADITISGARSVRDLWRQQDLGNFDQHFETRVPRHGVVLVRISPPKSLEK